LGVYFCVLFGPFRDQKLARHPAHSPRTSAAAKQETTEASRPAGGGRSVTENDCIGVDYGQLPPELEPSAQNSFPICGFVDIRI
ncbi:MAG: hypothetical protein VCA34_01755, partial [Roseibacillus sp.]